MPFFTTADVSVIAIETTRASATPAAPHHLPTVKVGGSHRWNRALPASGWNNNGTIPSLPPH